MSYKVGLTYDAALSENFSIIPGIELVNKSFKEDGIAGTINMYYAQVPVLAAYKVNVSDEAKLTLKAGPYASYGLFGSDIEFYGAGKVNVFDKDAFDRFDAGVKVGASVDFSSFTIGAEFSRGLVKLKSNIDAYNQAFGVILGYKF